MSAAGARIVIAHPTRACYDVDHVVHHSAETVCAVARDGHSLMLSTADGIAAPAMAWIGVATAQLFARCLDADVPVVQSPRHEDFAYTMRVADPDGNILWLGTAPRTATD